MGALVTCVMALVFVSSFKVGGGQDRAANATSRTIKPRAADFFAVVEPRFRMQWSLSAWGKCSRTCGRGHQSRSVVCRHVTEGDQPDGQQMPDMMCPAPKPHDRRVCSQVACSPTWVPQRWDKCDQACGRGVQRRQVRCVQLLGTGKRISVSPDFCPKSTPMSKQHCNLFDCPARYVAYKWGPCHQVAVRPHQRSSAPCGGGRGVQTRSVVCKQQLAGQHVEQRVPVDNCFRLTRPPSRRNCKVRACPSRHGAVHRLQTSSASTSLTSSKSSATPAGLISSSSSSSGGARKPPLFVQKAAATKLRLKVPVTAVVLPKTTLIVRCKLSGVAKKDVRWTRRGRVVPRVSSGRYTSLPDGSLRILHVRTNDSGRFTCSGSSPAAGALPFQLYVKRLRPGGFRRLPGRPRFMQPNQRGKSRQIVERPVVQHTDDPSVPMVGDTLFRVAPRVAVPAAKAHPSFLRQPIGHKPLVFNSPPRSVSEDAGDDVYDLADEYSDQKSPKRAFLAPEVQLAPEASRAPLINLQPKSDTLQLDNDVIAHVGGNLVVANADQVTILCESSGDPPPAYSWYKDLVRLPTNSRQIVLQDGSLRLISPQYADAGRYACVARNRHGNDTRSTVLRVTTAPRILATADAVRDFESLELAATIGSEIRARLGAKVTIRCATEGYPDPYVEWRKDKPGLRHNAHVLADNSLQIYPTDAADQGLFSCEASNPAGSDYQASSLVLIDPPHVTADMSSVIPNYDGMNGLPDLLLTGAQLPDYRVKFNSSVMMGCPLAGFPALKLTWELDGVDISQQARVLRHQLLHRGTVLQIPTANNRSSGVYTCRGSNEAGTATTSLRLAVISYTFVLGDFTPCNVTCGDGGLRHRDVICMEDGRQKVDAWYCTGIAPPSNDHVPCNRVDCPPRYITRPWAECSVTCGNGVRTRELSCGVRMVDGSVREVGLEECEGQPLPNVSAPCERDACPRWTTGPWKKCSKKCAGRGVGMQTRKVECVSNNGTIMPKITCKSQPRPRRKGTCANARCEPVWMASEWSVCSATCGSAGFQTRILNCAYQGRTGQSAGNLCAAEQRPPVSAPCNRKPCRPGPCTDRYRMCRRAIVNQMYMCRHYKSVCCRSCR